MSDDSAVQVLAEKKHDYGVDYWVGSCPRCGLRVCVSNQGKIICWCGTLLEIREKRSS